MKYNLFIIIILSLSWSCTTPIDLDVVYEKKIVVEGSISAANTAHVRLTQTVSATDEDLFPVVTNAVITLSDSDGNMEVLMEETDGVYTGNSIIGEGGKSYQLDIKTEEKTYTAQANLLDFSIDLEQLILTDAPSDTLEIIPQLLSIDLKKKETDSLYVIFSVALNGSEKQSFTFYKNEQPTVQNLNVPLQVFNFLKTDDVLTVEAIQVEKWLYEYWIQIPGSGNQEIISGLLIGPPSNLQGNINEDALGYFGATTHRFIEITIP